MENEYLFKIIVYVIVIAWLGLYVLRYIEFKRNFKNLDDSLMKLEDSKVMYILLNYTSQVNNVDTLLTPYNDRNGDTKVSIKYDSSNHTVNIFKDNENTIIYIPCENMRQVKKVTNRLLDTVNKITVNWYT